MKIRKWILGVAALASVGISGQSLAAECSLAPTLGTETRNINGRSYTVNVPIGLTGPEVPLLLSMHGAGGFSAQQEAVTGWTGYALQKGFIVVYPQALPNYSGLWDLAEGSDDVEYLRDVIADISSQYCIDADQIYADGHSRGAAMSHRLACDAGELVASVVSYGGGAPIFEGQACNPSRPVAVGQYHGLFDPYMVPDNDEASRDFWIENGYCDTAPEVTSDTFGETERYSGCADGVEIVYRSLNFHSHEWPYGPLGQELRDNMWTFLQSHPLPANPSPAGASHPGVECDYTDPNTWIACVPPPNQFWPPRF